MIFFQFNCVLYSNKKEKHIVNAIMFHFERSVIEVFFLLYILLEKYVRLRNDFFSI
jgi:hypothetical protein